MKFFSLNTITLKKPLRTEDTEYEFTSEDESLHTDPLSDGPTDPSEAKRLYLSLPRDHERTPLSTDPKEDSVDAQNAVTVTDDASRQILTEGPEWERQLASEYRLTEEHRHRMMREREMAERQENDENEIRRLKELLAGKENAQIDFSAEATSTDVRDEIEIIDPRDIQTKAVSDPVPEARRFLDKFEWPFKHSEWGNIYQ